MMTTHEARAGQVNGNVVLARRNRFPRGHISDPHRHDEAQFVLALGGGMIMDTEEGALMVPPNSAAWIPDGMVHNSKMMETVNTMTLWIERIPDFGLPENCRVISASPLMCGLWKEAMKIDSRTRRDTHMISIVKHLLAELELLPALPACLPLPKDARLAERCRNFLDNPSAQETIDEWSAMLGMSRRTFTRLFRRETSLSFAEWRRQACLFTALPRLAAGESITRIAFDLGYESPAAFTTMFTRQRGIPPSQYFRSSSRSATGISTSTP